MYACFIYNRQVFRYTSNKSVEKAQIKAFIKEKPLIVNYYMVKGK